MSEIRYNDGNGLLDDNGLIDSLILDCNALPKALFDGQNVRFCALIVEMVQKLGRLKDGVKNELDDRDRRIADMQRLNDELIGKAYGVPAGLPAERGNDGQGNDSEDRAAD